jgi:hypothetical protein
LFFYKNNSAVEGGWVTHFFSSGLCMGDSKLRNLPACAKHEGSCFFLFFSPGVFTRRTSPK